MNDTQTTEVVTAPAVDTLFLDLLRQHRHGDCMAEMSAALREVNKAAQLTGKAASVTLKIRVAPAGTIKGALAVGDEIKTTLPKEDKGASLFYANAEGALLRDDPNQQHLDLRVVNSGARDGAVELTKV